MSNNQQPRKLSVRARVSSAQAAARAQTTDRVVAKGKQFDNDHPKLKKRAVATNRFIARLLVMLKVCGFAAIVTSVITVLYVAMATIGLGEWSDVVKPAVLTAVFVTIYLWAESSTSK